MYDLNYCNIRDILMRMCMCMCISVFVSVRVCRCVSLVFFIYIESMRVHTSVLVCVCWYMSVGGQRLGATLIWVDPDISDWQGQ